MGRWEQHPGERITVDRVSSGHMPPGSYPRHAHEWFARAVTRGFALNPRSSARVRSRRDMSTPAAAASPPPSISPASLPLSSHHV